MFKIDFSNPNALLRFDDVMAYLNVSRSTMYRLTANGDLPPFFKIGGASFIRAGTFLRFLEEQERLAA